MTVPLWAGFECGRLPWNGHDLLQTTGHLPGGGMERHYDQALQHGVSAARDGLVPGHDPAARLAAAGAVPVVWDLMHFTRPENPWRHAEAAAAALEVSGRAVDRLLAVNEPSVAGVSGIHWADATALAVAMMHAAAGVCAASFVTCDPIHDLSDGTLAATDVLVGTGLITAVGVNYYPHHARESLADILRGVAGRYGLPVIVTETGWHDGLPEAHARFPHVGDRRGWPDHVRAEIARSGVLVEGLCWYPWLDMPAWDAPHTGERWPCGWAA